MSNKTFLTWDNIQEDCKLLADKLSDIKFTCIIGIANGGMIPATLLAKHLKVDKLLSANLKSYQEDKPRNGAHTTEDIVKVISFPSWVDLKEQDKILIVDDLSDTGLTLREVMKLQNIIVLPAAVGKHIKALSPGSLVSNHLCKESIACL